MQSKLAIAVGVAVLSLSACSERDVILPGKREAVDPAQTVSQVSGSQPISLPGASVNRNWTHRGGNAAHRIGHVALSATPQPLFAVSIGTGETRRARITADPVVAGGRIFTVDAASTVTATGVNGQHLWSRPLVTGADRLGQTSGGGLAFGNGKLFATTPYGELVALDPASGGEYWRQDLDAPGGSAPTVSGDLVYVAARDGRGWAVETGSGRVAWTLEGVPPVAVFGGGTGPAVTNEIAVFPMPSGEVLAAFPQGGLRRWSSVVSGTRNGSALLGIDDLAADPVIVGETLYVGNLAGSTVAMELSSGERIWTARMGALGPVVATGGSVFLVNDRNQLTRLNATDGSIIWSVTLPQFKKRRWGLPNTYYAQFGPVLAGGKLWVASSDGALRSFSPRSGAQLGQVALPGGAASAPVVAGGVLYVVSKDGVLHAFR